MFPRRVCASCVSDWLLSRTREESKRGGQDAKFSVAHLEQCRLLASTGPNDRPALSFPHSPINGSEDRSSAIGIAETIDIGLGDAYDIGGGVCCGGVLQSQQSASNHLRAKKRRRRLSCLQDARVVRYSTCNRMLNSLYDAYSALCSSMGEKMR